MITVVRAALPLAMVVLLALPSLGWGQQELRSGKKGATAPANVTSTSVDDNHQALDSHLATLLVCEDSLNSVCRIEQQWEYEDVAASQTDQVIGSTGAVGDLVAAVYCAMSAASVGTVSIKDGAGSAFVLFQAQAAATVVHAQALNWVSTSGAWKLTTGTNTTCRVSGRFN